MDKTNLQKVWEEWVWGLAEWKSFITLTFNTSDRYHEVTRTEAEFKFKMLVQSLNTDLFGSNYVRIVGHSYFSYAIAYEYQKRGVLHMHVVVDEPVNFQLLHVLWGRMAGFASIERVTDIGSVSYLVKYILKGGKFDVYKNRDDKIPAFQPLWYLIHKGGSKT